jgi:hypothetical protein
MSIDNVPELSNDEKDLLYETIFRLTDGLPARELELTVEEAIECEKALLKEIEILEAKLSESSSSAVDESQIINTKSEGGEVPSRPIIPIIPPEYDATLNNSSNFLSTANDILNYELSPLDRYFTVSSLLGRLREPFDTNPPPHSQLFQARQAVIVASDKKKKTVNNMTPSEQRKIQSIEKYKKMIDLKTLNEIYTQKQTDISGLLAFVKRISNHRTATVFRKAVNPSEAPGYTDRIKFPCDISLLKKFVLCGYIQTFQELHQQAGLIVHNCIKFNGRDSDYSIIAKEFEHYIDDSMLDIMQKRAALAANSASSATAAAPAEESTGKQEPDDATEKGSQGNGENIN